MRTLLLPFEPAAAGVATRPSVSRAERYRLYDERGRELIDGVSGMWHVNFGYSSEPIVNAIRVQLSRLPASSLISTVHEPALELSARLRHFLGLENYGVLFTNSGSEAIEAARHVVDIIAGRAGIRRARVGFLPGAFHGNTGRARRMSGNDTPKDGVLCATEGDALAEPAGLGLPWAVFFEPIQGVAGVTYIPQVEMLISRNFAPHRLSVVGSEK
jgi:adenosylmethionine-8-amino-7-oxononanoate aminotransferase